MVYKTFDFPTMLKILINLPILLSSVLGAHCVYAAEAPFVEHDDSRTVGLFQKADHPMVKFALQQMQKPVPLPGRRGFCLPAHPEQTFDILYNTRPSSTHLDLGAGRSWLGFLLALRGANIFINDIDEKFVENCEKEQQLLLKQFPAYKERIKQAYSGIQVFQEDVLTSLGRITEGSLDSVSALNLFHFLTNSKEAQCAASIQEKLASGGKFYLTVQETPREAKTVVEAQRRDESAPMFLKVTYLMGKKLSGTPFTHNFAYSIFPLTEGYEYDPLAYTVSGCNTGFVDGIPQIDFSTFDPNIREELAELTRAFFSHMRDRGKFFSSAQIGQRPIKHYPDGYLRNLFGEAMQNTLVYHKENRMAIIARYEKTR